MTAQSDRLDLLLRDLTSFVTLLDEEAKALTSSDPDRLSQLSGERQTLSLIIADHWKALAALLGVPPQAGLAALRDKALAGPGGAPDWRRLEDLAREATRLNQLNGRMIEEQMRRNQAAMQVLQRAASNRGLYGADGRITDFLQVNRNIDTA